jgi:hypothetical protein
MGELITWLSAEKCPIQGVLNTKSDAPTEVGTSDFVGYHDVGL